MQPESHRDGAATATVRAAVAVAEALFSRNGRPPSADRLRFVAAELGDLLDRAGPRTRLLVSTFIWVVTLIAPLLVARAGCLERLPVPRRALALERMEARFPAPLLAVKAVLCLVYYEHPDAAREVGFDGACRVVRPAPGSAA